MQYQVMIGAIALSAAVSVAAAQEATLKGKVLTDSTERPISGVIVAIDALKLTVTTDSAGDFVLRGIKAGAYVVTAKKIGFGALATRVRFTPSETVEADFLMTPGAQPLPEARVETKPKPAPKLVEFEERRSAGQGGRFLTQSDFERRAYSWTSDVLRQIPSLELVRDSRRPSQYYASAGRMQGSTRGGEAGGTGVCFAAVVLDGIFVYQGLPGELPFDINSLAPNTLAGFEYYASTASMPAKYNSGMRNTCGLVVLWTKI